MGSGRPNAIGSWCKQDPTPLGHAAMTQQHFRPQACGSTDLLAWVCNQVRVSDPSTQGMTTQHQSGAQPHPLAAFGTFCGRT